MAEVGRPTDYKAEYCEQAYKLCLLGLIDRELAEFFEISESTLNLWKLEYPDFSKSIKSGKDVANGNVAMSLYKRAIGYEHDDVDIKMYEGEIIKTPIVKHYPPDPASMIFFLKNRAPKKWRDKIETEHSGEIKGSIPVATWVEPKADGKTE